MEFKLNGNKLNGNMDAAVWVKEWLKIANGFTREQILDEGWMLGWFANSIMTGYDVGIEKGKNGEF